MVKITITEKPFKFHMQFNETSSFAVTASATGDTVDFTSQGDALTFETQHKFLHLQIAILHCFSLHAHEPKIELVRISEDIVDLLNSKNYFDLRGNLEVTFN